MSSVDSDGKEKGGGRKISAAEASGEKTNGVKDHPAAAEVVGQRMIFEDDLRKACQKRELEIVDQHAWMALRKKIPISLWVEHSFDSQMSKPEKIRFQRELEDYYLIFSGEAGERGLELDMERNYYLEAVERMSTFRQPENLKDKERKRLTELMIMVDFKDAKLGLQILKSIL